MVKIANFAKPETVVGNAFGQFVNFEGRQKSPRLIMRILIISFLLLMGLPNIGKSQTIIKMKSEGGVSIIPCKVNGLNLNFIFDTGASDVSISLTEASFMLKNGYLDKSDIIGTSKYLDANGNINEGVTINLKEIEIAGESEVIVVQKPKGITKSKKENLVSIKRLEMAVYTEGQKFKIK